MSISRVSVIPDVEGNFLVNDYSLPLLQRSYRRPIRILRPEVIDIVITNSTNIKQEIKNELTTLITDAVQVGIDNDINLITGDYENSPPLKIDPSELERLPIILGGDRAKFQIVGINNRVSRAFGMERVFKNAPPELLYDKTSYFQPDRKSLLFMDSDEEATCSYQYIYQTFGNKNGYKKLARDYKTIKYWCQKEPPQYQTWLRHYARERNIEVLDLNIQLAVDKEVNSFETELYSVNVTKIGEKENWTDEEIDKSMCVLDIIRWCMWAKINCYVIDYDGQYYMSYHHKKITEGFPDRKLKTNARSIVVKVTDNHAYFVTDTNLKKSACHTYENWKAEDFSETNYRNKNDEFELEDTENNFWIHPYHTARHQAEQDGILSSMEKENIQPFEIGWDKAYELLGKANPELYKNNPPPTPEEIFDDSGKTFYLGTDKLNGLVSHLYHNYNIKPDMMNGSTGHKIDRITYGSNKIMGRTTLPQYGDDVLDNNEIEKLKKLLPELDWSRLPTIKTIADELYKSIKKEQSVWSMFNSNTRRIFFDSEIKPSNQVYKKELDRGAWAVDISRAYTTAMNDYDLEWNIYDAVCQFEKYDGIFNPNYFYLVEELVDEFPLKQGAGLMLYHGCLLRHLLGKGKVIIKKVLKPIKTLDNEYFKEFVEYCNKLEHSSDSVISAKRLVNTFIGGLKNQDKIAHFKFHLTESETTITRAFYNGEIVSMLDLNTKFNKEYRYDNDPMYIISKPKTEYNIQSAQPIRLAIIDKVNEMLYLLHKEVEYALHEYNRIFNRQEKLELCLTKTDCLYYENQNCMNQSYKPITKSYKKFMESWGWSETLIEGSFPVNKLLEKVEDKLPFTIRKEQSVDKDEWVFKEYKTQNQVLQKKNFWKRQIEINHKWDKITGAKKIFKVINSLGGAWIEGEGGVGKTEFLKTFQQIIDRNRIRYRFQRCIHKHNENPRMFEDLEEWRKDNPCFAIKLAPTNKACNNIGGKTLHKGLGIPVMDVDFEDKTPSYFDKICSKLSGDGFSKPCYDWCIIDEISFMDGWEWSLIYALKRRIPHLKFILSGDIIRQLPPVGEEWRNFFNAYVIKELVGFTKVKFNYNFRTGLSGNILWKEWSKNPHRFEVDNNAPFTTRNICFTNIKRKQVISQLEDRIKKSGVPLMILKKIYDDPWGGMFEEPEDEKPDGQRPELVLMTGTPLIVYKAFKDYGLSKNEMRTVVTFDTDGYIKLDDGIEYPEKFIYDYFLSGYCITTHKSQGDTYKDRYTIHEWDKFSRRGLFKRRLRYVAQSRSTNPENNIVYKN